MNERIRELIDECTEWITGTIDGDVECFDKEKFALLIVRKCVSTLHAMHLWQSVNKQNYPSSWHDAVDQSIDAIKEHFGITE